MVKVCGPLETLPWDYAETAPDTGARRSGASRLTRVRTAVSRSRERTHTRVQCVAKILSVCGVIEIELGEAS